MLFSNLFYCTLLAITFLGNLLPLSKSGAWWIRAWDYPRPLIAVFTFVTLILTLTIVESELKWILTLVVMAFLFQEYRRLGLYLFKSLNFKPTSGLRGQGTLSVDILTFNVQVENTNTERLEEWLSANHADVIALFETNPVWKNWSEEKMETQYPFQYHEMVDNGYAISFLSTLPVENVKVSYLIDEGVPSIECDLFSPDDEKVKIFCVHPRPPRPQDGPSDQKDGELARLAGQIRNITSPVLVLGDFNDVPWSRSMSHFLKASVLTDPRQGRGLLPTVPSCAPWLGFPIDHIFCSDHFWVERLKVVRSLGSDHRPLYARVLLIKDGNLPKAKGVPSRGEEVRVEQELLERGKAWDGPNVKVQYRPWNKFAKRIQKKITDGN